MTYRIATANDVALLAEMNHQLIRDEGHRNPMAVPELHGRMKAWIESEYTAVLFEDEGSAAAYALYREQPGEIHLRQLFVARHLRRQGIGREAVDILRTKIWPANKRLTVDVLAHNAGALTFWRALGYRDYSLTLEILPEPKSQAVF